MTNLNDEQALEIEALAEEGKGITDEKAKSLFERTIAVISKSMGNKKAPAPAEDSEDEDEDESDDEDMDDSDDDKDEDDDSDSGDDEDEDDSDDEGDDDEDDEEDEKPVRGKRQIKKSFESDEEDEDEDFDAEDPFLSKSLDDSEGEDEDSAPLWTGAMLEHLEENERQNDTLIKCLLDMNERFVDVSERLEAIEGNQNGQSDAILEISKSIDSNSESQTENALLVKSLTEQMEGLSRTPAGTYSQLGVSRPDTLRKSLGDGVEGVTRSTPEKRCGLTHSEFVEGISIFTRNNPENDMGLDIATAGIEIKKSFADVDKKYLQVAADTLDIVLEED